MTSPRRRLPDEVLIELDERDECPVGHRPLHVQPRQTRHPTAVYSRRVRRHGRKHVRRLLHLRRDGADRPWHCHILVCHISWERSHHGRRHAGAEEALAEAASPTRACCSPTAQPSRKPAAIWVRSRRPRTASYRTARSSDTRSMAASSGSATAASPSLYTILANTAARAELVHRGAGRKRLRSR